jgi:molecular chaperone DnaJ
MDFYVILGVRQGASLDDIKRAYRRLARKFHPDINPGDRAAAQRFREIAEAYEVLSDEGRRQAYDSGRLAPRVTVEASFEFQGFDFSRPVEGNRAATFSDLFADALHAAARAPERGADLHETVALSFEEAARGVRRALTLTRLERCAPCRGAGVLPAAPQPCAMCEGTGQVRGARGHMVFSRQCQACGGAGHVRHRTCEACGGEGVGVHSGPVVVDLPPGLADGAVASLPGQGHAGRRGGPPGDLRLSIAVTPHRFFRRAGDDVLVEVPIAIHEAALGARIEVPAVDGPARLRIPPGTQGGQVFRLRERGAPSPRSGHRGDLVVTVRLVLPRLIDERSKELLRQFGELNTDNVRADLGV